LANEKAEMVPIFKAHGIDSTTEKVIMISILGSETSKTYPEDYMVQLIDFIAEHFAVKILFNYTPKQQKEAQSIFNKCQEKTKKRILLDLIGKDLRSFIKIMHHCALIVGNDGGAVNIAKALQKPSFTIFSPWIKKESWSIFDDGVLNKAVHLNDYQPELFSSKKNKELQVQYKTLYHAFKPEYFVKELEMFLKNNGI
jgi:heptosyltransferase-2